MNQKSKTNKLSESAERAVNIGRERAIHKTHIPDAIKEVFDVSVENGKIVLQDKNDKR